VSLKDGDMQQVGLLGWPVAHSISPAMFNAAFESLGMNWRYTAFAVAPDQLKQTLHDLQRQGVRGLNVTVPHKQAVIPFVDVLHTEAKAVGAVNTITFTNSDGTVKLHGTNTDIEGFRADLVAFLDMDETRPLRALVLGSGGSARAATYVLAQLGYQITVVARNPNRALELIRDVQIGFATPARAVPADITSTQWRMKMVAVPWDRLGQVSPRADLIVNCTPVGMWPQDHESPWPNHVPIPATAMVYDMVYRPAKTRLIRQAEAAGSRAIGGLGMLVKQGAAAFRLWTGKEPPLDVMMQAAQKALDL